MSHHIYTTPGFIVHSAPHGEAGKFYLLFTRDLGMIGTTAQGVRLSQSKLRYHTQDYSYGLFSVVRGKEVWRMTGAKEIEGIGLLPVSNRKLFVRIISLLKRLLHGEEKNEKLFEIVEKLYMYLASSSDSLEYIEYITVLRILDCLGYLSHGAIFKDLISNTDITDDLLVQVENDKDIIIEEINNALKESQL